MIGIEPDRLIREPDEAPEQQARADEQHDRQRHFGNHEHLAQPAPPGRLAAARGFLQRLIGPQRARLQRRRQTEDQRRGERRDQPRDEHTSVDPDVLDSRNAGRRERQQQLRAPRRQEHAEHAAHHGERGALGQELANQPPASRAERGANRQLPVPRDASGRQQIGDVDARDEQHEPDGGQQM